MNKKIIFLLIAFIIGIKVVNAFAIPATINNYVCSSVTGGVQCQVIVVANETTTLSGYDIWYADFKSPSDNNRVELVSNSDYATISNIKSINTGGVFRVDYKGDVQKDQPLTLFTVRFIYGGTPSSSGTITPFTVTMGDWDDDYEVGPTDVVNYRKYLANDSAIKETYAALTPAKLYALDLKFDNEINLVDLIQARLIAAD